jgi:hypothetical protein
MKISSFLILTALMVLTACSTSHRPTYSGHEERTYLHIDLGAAVAGYRRRAVRRRK